VQRYRELPDAELLVAASAIWETFVSDSSPRKINITSETFIAISQEIQMKRVNKVSFDSAQTQVVQLMRANNYGNYRHSQHFEDWLISQGVNAAQLRASYKKGKKKTSKKDT